MSNVTKILILDDESDIRELLEAYFNRVFNNISVLLFDDAASALKAMKCNEFDIVCFDIGMPKMNGIDFLKQAKQIKKNGKLVCISGFTAMLESDLADANLILNKPFNLKQIEEIKAII